MSADIEVGQVLHLHELQLFLFKLLVFVTLYVDLGLPRSVVLEGARRVGNRQPGATAGARLIGNRHRSAAPGDIDPA
jgi:hypothetical protein